MKKIKKNVKGMTLIEVVVSLLIVSTASLIMVQGFVTVNRLFSQSNQYNETTSKVRAALISDENGEVDSTDDVKVKCEEATAQVYFYKGTSQEVFLQGSVYRATSNQFSDNQLRTFTSNTTLKPVAPDEPSEDVATGLYKSYCRMMEEIRDYLKEKKCGSADNLNRVKGYIREYLLQYTTEEQLIKLGINTNTNLVDKLGEVYIARYYPTKTEMPSITENTAKALGKWNDNIYSQSKNVYPGTNGENYCYPTLIPTFKSTDSLYDIFENNDAYKDKIFIALYNHNDVQLPNTIQAIYNNNSKDTDEWYVYDKLDNGEKNIYKREDFLKNYSKFSDFNSKYYATRWQKISAQE